MHYLSLIYFINRPLHVSAMYIAHHQEVFTVYVQQLVRVIRLGDWQLTSWSMYYTYFLQKLLVQKILCR
jgi:hypothetical protein